jgi:hypothetical protein
MLDAALRDRAAYLRGADALVLADLHLGRAAASSVDFPLGERAGLRERLVDLLDRFQPATVVLAGDVLHEFGRVGPEAEAGLASLVGACREAEADPVAVAGNHDALLADVWDGPVYDEYRPGSDPNSDVADPDPNVTDAGDGVTDADSDGSGRPDATDAECGGAGAGSYVLVCHGHEAPAGEADLYVVGHDHPAIDVEGRKRPCFLYGPDTYRGGDVLMLPAFTRLAAGCTINGMGTRDFDSPLVTDADALRPLVYDAECEETLSFPPLGRFRRLL